MPTYYFSGVDRPSHLALLAKEHAAGMINARIALQKNLQYSYLYQHATVQLVLDSGMQPWVDRQAFLAIVEQVGQRFDWISALDVISNQKESNRNFEFLHARLPFHLHHRLLWIFQTDGSLNELEQMAASRKLVGLGGFVPLLKQRGADHVLRKLTRIGERLLSVNGQAHLFGISSPNVLFHINQQRWLASVDSSKWLIAYKAAQVVRRDGTGQCQAEHLGLCLTADEMAANNIRVMRFWLLPQHFTQLLLLEERLDTSPQREHVPLYRYIVQLCGENRQDSFFEHFVRWVVGCDGGDEEDEILIALVAPDTFEQECLTWCEHAMHTGGVRDYDVWRNEEEENIA